MTREEIIEMISNMYLKAVGAYQCCQKHGKEDSTAAVEAGCDRLRSYSHADREGRG